LSRSDGVLLGEVDAGTPADEAGLRMGDIVIQLDDTTIEKESDLFKFLRKKNPGDVITVVVDRDGSTESLQLTLGDRPRY